MENSTFSNNRSYSGGAIYLKSCTGDNLFKNCTFKENNSIKKSTGDVVGGGALALDVRLQFNF